MEEEEDDLEYALANHVRVLETNVLHATDVIYWLDGSSANNSTEMQRVAKNLRIQFANKPADLSVLHSLGKTALWRRPTSAMVNGEANEAEKTRAPQTPFDLSGELWDDARYFNPTAFTVSVGSGSGQEVVVYPSPFGTQVSSAGAVYGRALVDASGNPVIWGILELVITLSASEDLSVRAQTDANGDFVIPLRRLPPLPESITEYAAQLSLTGNLANDAETAPDASTFSSLQMESLTSATSFSNSVSLDIVPGQRTRINSAGKNYLAVA